MSKKRYVVRLSMREREDLSALIKRGKHKVSGLKRSHARVLLKVDQGQRGPSWSDVRTGEAFEIHATTVRAIRERFVLEGLEAALQRKKQSRPSVRRKLDGAKEARVNTHTIGSLYETFEPAVARRLAKRLEIHYTPKHGSWLNIAEIELQVLSRQCLDRRIDKRADLEREVQAWTDHRNASITAVDWQFTTSKARIKLKRLYPEFTV